MHRIQYLSIVGNLFLLVLILNFIRTGRIKVRYALLWIVTCLVMLFLSFWKQFLDLVAPITGIYYPPNVLFLTAFLFLLIISVHFSLVISSLSEHNRELAREIALIAEKSSRLEKALERLKAGGNPAEGKDRGDATAQMPRA